jgi:hypothetical protein
MCQHCESEECMQESVVKAGPCSSRYIEGCSSSNGYHTSRIVIGCEDDSLSDVTVSPPLASSTFRDPKRRPRPRTPPEASSTFIHFPAEESKVSKCGKSSHDTGELTRMSRDRRRYSIGLFRSSTRNDLSEIDLDERLSIPA